METVFKRRGGNIRNGRTTFPGAQRRQEAAKLRQEATSKLTPQERLARLDAAFGPGQGAQKERAKLAKLIQAQQEPAPKKKKATA